MSTTVWPAMRRWLVPFAAALAVIGGGVAIGAITRATDSSLDPRSAQDLLTDVATAKVDGFSGTVTVRADLGLPAIPVTGSGGADLTTLMSGTHTLRVWYASPKQARVALLGQLSETDVITDGTQLWIWSSKDNTATHATLPEGGIGGLGSLLGGMGKGEGGPMPSGMPTGMPSGMKSGLPNGLPSGAASLSITPDTMAKMLLQFLQPFTDISVDNTATVAGRSAYAVTLKPKDDNATLLDSIVIDIDGAEKVPLRVAVNAKGASSPAIEIGFTEVTFGKPDPAQFTFNPPPGAKVVEQSTDSNASGTPTPSAKPSTDAGKPSTNAEAKAPKFALVGKGWSTVLAVRLPADALKPSSDANPIAALVKLLPTVSGTWGSGHVLSSALATILITDDGRVLIGAVTPDALTQAAADPAAQLPA